MNEWMIMQAQARAKQRRFLAGWFEPIRTCVFFWPVSNRVVSGFLVYCSVNIKTPAKHRLWKLLGNCFLNRWSGPSHHSIRQMAAVRLTMDFFFPQSSYWNHLLCVYSTEAWHSGKTRCRWSGNWWWRFRLCSRETWLCSSWSVDTRSQCRAPISR